MSERRRPVNPITDPPSFAAPLKAVLTDGEVPLDPGEELDADKAV